MTRIARRAWIAAFIASLLLVAQTLPSPAQGASANDTARYLAGLAPDANSPLASLTREPGWKRHAKILDQAWSRLAKRQLAPIRAWSKQHVQGHRELMLYMFSGPDFLYADAFYPNAKTYILSALEPVGPTPNVARMSRGGRAGALQELRASMQTVLSYSFFITKQMKSALRNGNMRGTLPLLYVFLARSGKTIKQVEFVDLNPDGTVSPRGGKARKGRSAGAKIVFAGSDAVSRTLYYFRTDLSNGGLKASGFRKFVQSFGKADSLLKSASYLLHSGNFTTARKFALEQSVTLIQDPSGVPLRNFDRKAWDLHPFGKYLGPINVFPGRYQRDLRQLFRSGRAKPIKFGIGYRWRTHETSVLLAIKKSVTKASAQVTPSAEASATGSTPRPTAH